MVGTSGQSGVRWAAGILAAALALACGPSAREAELDDRPVQVLEDGYVSSETCQACHPREYATWHRSYHRTMTQLPSPESVVPALDGIRFSDAGRRYRLEQRGDEYFVEIHDSRAGTRERHPIVLTTGSHRFQVFWHSSGEERAIDLLPYCYQIDEQRWTPIHAVFLTPPGSRQSTQGARWNRTCNRCHTTGGQPRLFEDGTVDTRVAEFGIACESCHGPAAAHVAANRDPSRRYRLHLGDASDPTVVLPPTLLEARNSQICGQCHAVTTPIDEIERQRFQRTGYSYRPGDDLHVTRAFKRDGLNRFWSDGMVRVSGREYTALLDTPCFTHGDESRGILSCSDCHQMHRAADDPRPLDAWADDQLKPGHRGNAACVSCHPQYAGEAELTAHAHHDAGSLGSNCLDCHMPNTAWGQMKATRSHQVSSPTAAESVETGRPNACSLCHLDRTLAWTADALEEWYGQEPPELDEEQRSVAASVLWLLRGDAGQRAVVAWNMGWEPARRTSGTAWMPPYLAQLLVDPYPPVRLAAFRSLRRIEGYTDLDYDFVDKPERLAAARSQVTASWIATRGGEDARAAEGTLVASGGSLRWSELQRLLANRDDRPVRLSE